MLRDLAVMVRPPSLIRAWRWDQAIMTAKYFLIFTFLNLIFHFYILTFLHFYIFTLLHFYTFKIFTSAQLIL